MKIKPKLTLRNYAEAPYGIYILGGSLMFKLNRQTGETWVYKENRWSVVLVEGLDKGTQGK